MRGESYGSACHHCALDTSKRDGGNSMCFNMSVRSWTTSSGWSSDRDVILRICGAIDFLRKKSCGLAETTAFKWSCVVGDSAGSSEGNAIPAGRSKHAARSFVDCRLRLREGMNVLSPWCIKD